MTRPGVNTTQITIIEPLWHVGPRLGHIPRRIRPACLGAVVMALDWQVRRSSPGIPNAAFDDLCMTPAMVKALVSADVIRLDDPKVGWWTVNPELLGARAYRAGKSVPLHPSVVRFVFERDGYRCADCGTADDLTCDHVIPRASGGPDDSCNLLTRCRPCNARKGSRLGVA